MYFSDVTGRIVGRLIEVLSTCSTPFASLPMADVSRSCRLNQLHWLVLAVMQPPPSGAAPVVDAPEPSTE